MTPDWPRVSTILKDMGLVKPMPEGLPALEWGRARGSAVHAAIALYEAGSLDPASLHPDVVGCFEGYLRFKLEQEFLPLAVELPVQHDSLRYRGTLDAHGTVKGGGTVLVDFKCSKQPDLTACAYQLAAYGLTFKAPDAPEEQWCVSLRSDGTYRLWDVWSMKAEEVFMAAVTVWWAQRERNP